jgi:hypothetical protein
MLPVMPNRDTMRNIGRPKPKAWIFRLKTGWIRRVSTAFSGPG